MSERESKPEWVRMVEALLLSWIAIFVLLTWVAALVVEVRLA